MSSTERRTPPHPFLVAADVLDPPLPPESEASRIWRTRLARPSQLPPEGAWRVWLIMAGRGWGKTRTGAEALHSLVMSGRYPSPVLLAGRKPAEVRDYQLNGPGGLLTHHPEVRHVESKRLLIWPNGVEGLIRSGANPKEFRGFGGSIAWLDELPAWAYPERAYHNLVLGMREKGARPRQIITTTPRPTALMRRLVAMPGAAITRGSTYENRDNLAPEFLADVEAAIPPGSRLHRQEILGELLADVEGALWTLDRIAELRRAPTDHPPLERVGVGVDPQGRAGVGKMTGIVVTGRGTNGRLYVLEDASVNASPDGWARAAVSAYDRWRADHIVGERNFGGDMVRHTIRTVRADIPFYEAHASRGKIVRAAPVSALYEGGRAHHLGHFPALEDELSSYNGDGDSPNRLDALVWAAHYCMPELGGRRSTSNGAGRLVY